MGELKVRKIGNSVGALSPNEWGLQDGDVLEYTKERGKYILDVQNAAKNHDRQLIEESFANFAARHFSIEEHWIIFYQETGLSSIEDKASSFVLYGKGRLLYEKTCLFYPRKIPWKPSIHSLKPIA
ncbi:hypothetical protein [Candidatus Enterococcus ferrettii]|uniref:Uncharacterized protein n=1 Tax=Candidatus Enterococcus ferrettii TaxID=2815324 RepID=A0ABV0EID5_9ENTE|nr:hypothetical protein [Enterococcus sp. 665A]